MRFVLSIAIACLALGFGGTQTATAQYPAYAPRGFAPQSYGYPGYGQGHHGHHHHCAPSASQYYTQYGSPVLPYAPSAGYTPTYGANPIYAQPVVPPTSFYYSNSNNYYGRQPIDVGHPWHLGHYLLGN